MVVEDDDDGQVAHRSQRSRPGSQNEATRRRTGPVPGKDRHGQSGPAESSRQASDRGEGRCNDERVAPTGGGKDEREDVGVRRKAHDRPRHVERRLGPEGRTGGDRYSTGRCRQRTHPVGRRGRGQQRSGAPRPPVGSPAGELDHVAVGSLASEVSEGPERHAGWRLDVVLDHPASDPTAGKDHADLAAHPDQFGPPVLLPRRRDQVVERPVDGRNIGQDAYDASGGRFGGGLVDRLGGVPVEGKPALAFGGTGHPDGRLRPGRGTTGPRRPGSPAPTGNRRVRSARRRRSAGRSAASGRGRG